MTPTLDALLEASPEALRDLAAEHAPTLPRGTDRDVSIAAILDAVDPGEAWGAGVCEVHGEGFAFLRAPVDQLLPGPHDIYLSPNQVRRMELQTGDTVIGKTRAPHANERYPAMLWIGAINGQAPSPDRPAPRTDRVHPTIRLPLAADPWLARVDQVAPLGLGARGLLHGPDGRPRADLLRRIAARLADEPALQVSVLLAGGRPEEAHAWRAVDGVEVLAVPADETGARIAGVADLVMARAARRADHGAEHVVLIDGLDVLALAVLEDEDTPAAAMQRFRRWMLVAGDRPDAGSVTLVAAADPDAMPAAAQRDAARLATWTLWLSGGTEGEHALPALDVHRSGAFDEAALLDDTERTRRDRWRRDLPADPRAARAALDALFDARSA